MKLPLIILAAALATQISTAGPEEFVWRDAAGNLTPDTPAMKSRKGFGGHFILTTNEDIHSEWAKPKMPRIEIARKLPVGKLLLPLVIFVNPEKGPDETVDVVCDLEVIKPDGSISRKIPGIVCARGPVEGPPFNLQLSRSKVKWAAEEGDPLGLWTFKLLLKDKIRGTELPLEASVEVVRPEPVGVPQPTR